MEERGWGGTKLGTENERRRGRWEAQLRPVREIARRRISDARVPPPGRWSASRQAWAQAPAGTQHPMESPRAPASRAQRLRPRKSNC
eukprot:6188352-Pleurochrysis_carterae.AAC.3